MDYFGAIKQSWELAISQHVGSPAVVQRVGIVGGGSINEARKLHTSQGSFFVKLNSNESFPGMFEAEYKGLLFLAEMSDFAVPHPIATGVDNGSQWIVMEHIEGSQPANDFWECFGRKLASMHKRTGDYFGLEYNNYLGSLSQNNTAASTWVDFFITRRLEPQVALGAEKGVLQKEHIRYFNQLYGKLQGYFPIEPPAALHGDLWSGNFLSGPGGVVHLFDPSVYFGHREMDIAMTRMFGQFKGAFYSAYHEAYPLESGWEERIAIANLYPLLAHANLFGGSYIAQVTSALRRHA